MSVNYELLHKIRQHINRIEKKNELLERKQKWLRVTASLDVLEDTASAITYYQSSEYPSELNGRYLFTYGLLQALFVQLDAVNSIHCALFDKQVDFKTSYPDAFAIRNMRNDVIGHPTCRNNKEFIYLVQHSLSKEGFSYIKAEDDNNQSQVIDVDVQKAVSDATACVNMILTAMVGLLDKEFREYIDKHKSRKMKEIFVQLGYVREKVLTADSCFSDWGFSTAKDMVKRCEDELRLRYDTIESLDSYSYLLDEIHEIFDLIDNSLLRVPVEYRAGIRKYLLQLLFVKLEELESYCEETDQYFEHYGNPPCECLEGAYTPDIILKGENELTD